MKTTTAERHGFVCPKCHQQLSQDLAGKGFVRHLSKNSKDYCDYEPTGSKDSAIDERETIEITPHRASGLYR